MIRHNDSSVEFTAEDRCDRCIGRAYMLACKGSLELMFCFHHMNEYKNPLSQDEWELCFDYGGIEDLTNPSHEAQPV